MMQAVMTSQCGGAMCALPQAQASHTTSLPSVGMLKYWGSIFPPDLDFREGQLSVKFKMQAKYIGLKP